MAADVAVTSRRSRQAWQAGGAQARHPVAGLRAGIPAAAAAAVTAAVPKVRAQHLKAPLRPFALLLGELAQRDHDAWLQAAAASSAAADRWAARGVGTRWRG